MSEDDGIMLNISTGMQRAGLKELGEKKKKSDLKKLKYSRVLKGKFNGVNFRQKTNVSGENMKERERSWGRVPNGQMKSDYLENAEYKKQSEEHFQKEQKRFSSNRRARDSISTQKFQPENIQKANVIELLPEQSEEQDVINTTEVENLHLASKLEESLKKSGVAKLTEIQMKSFPFLNNSVDSIMKASTGSGKTLAYLIPLVNKILKDSLITKREDGTTVLVICPTRELCVQGQKQATRCLKRCPYIVAGCLYGGEETNHEKSRLRKGTNILFCTPGRLLYHLQNTKSFKIANLKALVFEQADRTLDMGFQESVQKIINIIDQKIPLTEIHKILVSAHFNTKVSSLLESLKMNEAKFIGFENIKQQMSLEMLKKNKDNEINTSQHLKQQYVLISQQQKIPLLMAYLGVLKQSKVLIFVSTIDEVQFLDYLFNNIKYKDCNGNSTDLNFESRPVYKIHGDLDQKLRSKTYLSFRASKESILISTEVASRGLDFPDLSHIILFDVPPSITDYGNRVGRSARFNQTGVSLLMLHYHESDYAETIRYYSPNLQLIEKDLIYDNFNKVLKSMNIGDSSQHYIEGLVRSAVKDDDQKYQIARKAYVSMLRAYARLPDKHIFAVKKLNLKLLARTFGLNNAKAGNNYNPNAKTSHLEANRKRRKVEDVRKLQVSQYM